MDKSVWIDSNKVYAIKRGDRPANEIVLYADGAFEDFEGICYLTAGERGHMIDGVIDTQTDTGFTFKPEHINGGEEWEFIEVTYDYFKDELYKIVIDGEKVLDEVTNTQELTVWYHNQFSRG